MYMYLVNTTNVCTSYLIDSERYPTLYLELVTCTHTACTKLLMYMYTYRIHVVKY